MKRFSLILITYLFFIFISKQIGINIKSVMNDNKRVFTIVKNAPEYWKKDEPEFHYHKQLIIYEEYSPRIFWLKTIKSDTLKTYIIKHKN